MLSPGVYPASVTPMTPDGAIDADSAVRLWAGFEAAGCKGILIAGTNGEGSHLSAIERRDLARLAGAAAGRLDVILGLATSILPEAVWLTEQASKAGVKVVLVNPPCAYRSAPWDGVLAWFEAFSRASALPWMFYNFPKMFQYGLGKAELEALADMPGFVGVKDSSGVAENIDLFRSVLTQGQILLVGDERLLPQAMEGGWQGTISGASNLVAPWLARYVSQRDHTAWELLLPALECIRCNLQPATNKAVLAHWGRIPSGYIRPPNQPGEILPVLETLAVRLGIKE